MRALTDYLGRWLVLFSHPADFTPVCTSEFIAFARRAPHFTAIGCDLLGLSIDSLYAHLAWVHAIRQEFGVEIPFPIIEDVSMAISRAYGMLPEDATDTSDVRATFVIDPAGVVRALLYYPMDIGRDVGEVLRLVQALQAADREVAATPEGWRPGDPLIEPPPHDTEELDAAVSRGGAWYYQFRSGKSL
jgi:peroxiredoxin 2/4